MPANPHRIKCSVLKEDLGIDTQVEWEHQIERWVMDGTVPALCDQGCEVEPDGVCPHNCPSVLLALGVI